MVTLRGEIKSVFISIIPIVALVIILDIFLAGIDLNEFIAFLICVCLVVVGFAAFLIGVDVGILPMGKSIGAEIPRRNSIIFTVGIIFIISFLITVAEPDVRIFSESVVDILTTLNVNLLIYVISIGVGIFLIISVLKMIYNIPLKIILMASYGIVLILSFFTPSEFLGIAFDAGGVTTGPMTVPVLIALGLGMCSVIQSRSEVEGFGMIGVASVGPIMGVMILGILFPEMAPESANAASALIIGGGPFDNFQAILMETVEGTAIALVPLTAFFVIFQRAFLKYPWPKVKEMVVGMGIAGVGIIMFLTGVFSGFKPLATSIGTGLAEMDPAVIILVGAAMGFLVAFAEPAVKILSEQVELASHGVFPRKLLVIVLAVGVSCLVGIGMMRLVFNINFMYIIVPGYIIALILMIFCDKDLVGIAFDAGGVATGPMAVAVIMTMYIAISAALYTDPYEAIVNGFGMVAMIALAPLIFISGLGVIIRIYKKRNVNLNDM